MPRVLLIVLVVVLALPALAQEAVSPEAVAPPPSWSEWLNAAIPLLLLGCAWLARRGGKMARVAAALVRVIEDREDPALKAQAKAEAERAGVQPVLAPIVKRETARLDAGKVGGA